MMRVFSAALLAVCLATPAGASGRLFVVSKEKKALQVFDADTGALEFEVTGAGDPHQVVLTADGLRAYIADAKGTTNTISVVDVKKRAIVKSLDIKPYAMPHGLVLTRDGSKLYVTSGAARCVLEVTTSPLKVTRAYKFFFENVENVAMTPDEKLVFATSNNDGNAIVINPAKDPDIETSILTGYGAEGLAVTPDGTELWVANRAAQTITVIDIATRKRLQDIKCVGNPMHVYFTAGGSQVVVTCAVADRLVLIDRAKRTEITRFEVGDFPVQMAFGEKNGPVFVTCARANDVAVVDLAAQKVIRRIPCGGDPEGIAFAKK